MATISEIKQALERIELAHTAHKNGNITYLTLDIEFSKFGVQSQDWLSDLLTANERLQAVVEAARALVESGTLAVAFKHDDYCKCCSERLPNHAANCPLQALQTALAALDAQEATNASKL